MDLHNRKKIMAFVVPIRKFFEPLAKCFVPEGVKNSLRLPSHHLIYSHHLKCPTFAFPTVARGAWRPTLEAFSRSPLQRMAKRLPLEVRVSRHDLKYRRRCVGVGSQGTRLFNLADMTEIKRASGAGSRGHTVSLLWARQTEEHHDVLYSGTQNGYFVCWRQDKESKAFEETFAQQITHAGEITGLGFDSTNNRLCLCSRTDVVQSWAISKDANTGMWKATNIFSQKYSNFVPRSITFAAFDNSSDRDIIVFGSGHNGPV